MPYAAFGITALLIAVPMAYETSRLAGATHLKVLTQHSVRPTGRSLFQVNALPRSGHRWVLTMGFMTTMLSPEAALLYLALSPEFEVQGHGSILSQTLILGAVHIPLNLIFGVLIASTAGAIASGLAKRRSWHNVGS